MSGPARMLTVLRQVAVFLRSNSLLIACCIIVAIGSSIAYSQTQESTFRADAVINYRPAAFYQRILELGPATASNEMINTAVNADEVDTERINEMIAEQLGLTQSEIADIEVIPQANSDLIDIEAIDSDPNRAASLADSYAAAYVAARRSLDRASARELAAAVRELRTNSSDLGWNSRETSENSFRTVYDQLKLLRTADTGNEFVKESAEVPQDPAEPRIFRSSVLAAVAGLFIGIAFAMRPYRSTPRPPHKDSDFRE